MAVSDVLKLFKADADVLGLSENAFLMQLITLANSGNIAAKIKLKEMKAAATIPNDINFFTDIIGAAAAVEAVNATRVGLLEENKDIMISDFMRIQNSLQKISGKLTSLSAATTPDDLEFYVNLVSEKLKLLNNFNHSKKYATPTTVKEFLELTCKPGNLRYLCVKANTSASKASLVIQDITYQAKAIEGETISISYVDPGSPSQTLSVLVVGQVITVNLATDGSSVITSTADDIKALIDADTDASALITATVTGTGTNVQAAVSEINLVKESLTIDVLLNEISLFSFLLDENLLDGKVKVSLIPTNKFLIGTMLELDLVYNSSAINTMAEIYISII